MISSSLPREDGCIVDHIYKYQGFWYMEGYLDGLLAFQKQFKANDTDILLASTPKSGTTWLIALAFAIINRQRYCFTTSEDNQKHPLLTKSPHELVPVLEDVYALVKDDHDQCQGTDLVTTASNPDGKDHFERRMFVTHLPYTALPESIKDVESSKCKIIYVCRDPKDNLISLWHFINRLRPNRNLEPISLEVLFERYCKGIVTYGPIWDHVLGYWKQSLERPEKVCFMKYEEMKREPKFHLRKLAEFMGHPFSMEEEKRGVVDDIVRLCSFDNLNELNKQGEVVRLLSFENMNKTRKNLLSINKNSWFRRGQVGDYANYLTPEMIECLDKITEEKLHGSGLQL
ncbi:hypothetical protein MKW94_009856 [Papaver nudicaule]|uniref:Sulfotransferase n=1 Tax=Papaver nudicaule TaxID=74823 RepID=A0AA41V6G6_PAPNU|nr:hypothetical protein [Papaver nudicaule]